MKEKCTGVLTVVQFLVLIIPDSPFWKPASFDEIWKKKKKIALGLALILFDKVLTSLRGISVKDRKLISFL